MKGLVFDWDPDKASANLKKHGVAFEEARSTFFDECAILYHDPDHSEDEDRFLLLGISMRLHVLIVSHCFREDDAVIRIISARKADNVEEQQYWKARK